MRNFLDNILSEIGSESLTDEEFATVTLPEPPTLNRDTYLALRTILQSREAVTGQIKKLRFYFIAKGIDLVGAPSTIPTSQIFIGSPL